MMMSFIWPPCHCGSISERQITRPSESDGVHADPLNGAHGLILSMDNILSAIRNVFSKTQYIQFQKHA